MASDSEERGEVKEVVQVRRSREGDEVQQGCPEDLSRPSEEDQSPAVPLSWVQIKFLSFLLSFLCVMAKRPVKAAAKARAVVKRLKSKLSKAQKKASKLSAACSRGKTKKSYKKSKKSRKSRKTRRH